MRNRWSATILTVTAVAAFSGGAIASAAAAAKATPTLTGTWTGAYSGTYRGTFTLHWKQTKSRLSGTIKLSTAGTSTISGSVRSNTIRFGTVGSQAITYSGSVSGNAMSGTWKAGAATGSWRAHKK